MLPVRSAVESESPLPLPPVCHACGGFISQVKSPLPSSHCGYGLLWRVDMVPALPRHVMPSFPLCFYGPRLPAALAGVLAPQHKHAHSTRPALAQPPNLPAHGTPQEIVIARPIRRLCNQRDCHLRDVCNQPIRGQRDCHLRGARAWCSGSRGSRSMCWRSAPSTRRQSRGGRRSTRPARHGEGRGQVMW